MTEPVKQAVSLKATGETKVTRKHVSGSRLPAKVQHQFISAVGDFKRELGTLLDYSDDDELTITISGKTLNALFAAHGQCVIPEDGEL